MAMLHLAIQYQNHAMTNIVQKTYQGQWFLLVNAPHSKMPILPCSHPVLLVQQSYAVQAGLRPVEDQLAFLHNLPDPGSAVPAPGSDASLPSPTVDGTDGILVTKQSLHVGLLVHGPDLDTPVKAGAVQGVAATSEHQARYGISVALECVDPVHGGRVPDVDELVHVPTSQVLPITGDCKGQDSVAVATVITLLPLPPSWQAEQLLSRLQVPDHNTGILAGAVHPGAVG